MKCGFSSIEPLSPKLTSESQATSLVLVTYGGVSLNSYEKAINRAWDSPDGVLLEREVGVERTERLLLDV